MQKAKKIENTNRKEKTFAILSGCLAGIINGLFGGGGGMIIVPVLVMLLKFQRRNAHATAILVILPLSIVSSLFYAVFGNLDTAVAIPVGIGVIVGGGIGAFMLSKISNKWLIIVFSLVMAGAGVKMLFF